MFYGLQRDEDSDISLVGGQIKYLQKCVGFSRNRIWDLQDGDQHLFDRIWNLMFNVIYPSFLLFPTVVSQKCLLHLFCSHFKSDTKKRKKDRSCRANSWVFVPFFTSGVCVHRTAKMDQIRLISFVVLLPQKSAAAALNVPLQFRCCTDTVTKLKLG